MKIEKVITGNLQLDLGRISFGTSANAQDAIEAIDEALEKGCCPK